MLSLEMLATGNPLKSIHVLAGLSSINMTRKNVERMRTAAKRRRRLTEGKLKEDRKIP